MNIENVQDLINLCDFYEKIKNNEDNNEDNNEGNGDSIRNKQTKLRDIGVIMLSARKSSIQSHEILYRSNQSEGKKKIIEELDNMINTIKTIKNINNDKTY